MTWVIAVVINGLTFVTLSPFNSEEACILAQTQAHVGECIAVELAETD